MIFCSQGRIKGCGLEVFQDISALLKKSGTEKEKCALDLRLGKQSGVIQNGGLVDEFAKIECRAVGEQMKRPIKSSHLCNEFAPTCAAHPLSNFASSYSG